MKNNYILALFTGVILWLAWPPIPFTSPLLFFAFIPLLFALENIIIGDYRKKGTKVFLSAGLACFIWNTASIYWIYNAINSLGLSSIATLLISLIPFCLAAALMAASFWLYYQARKRFNFITSASAFVCFWIAYEFLHQSWELAFPWMTLGNGFATFHQLIQWYEYTGVYGGTLWVLLSNLLLFFAVRSVNYPKEKLAFSKSGILLWAALIVVPMAISLLQYYTYEEHINPANIVVVQPNIDPYAKYDTNNMPVDVQLEHLIQLSDSVAQPNTEFFIWPETAIAENTNENTIRQTQSFNRIQQFLNNYKNGNLLSGIESYLIYDSAETISAMPIPPYGYIDGFNAAVLIENSERVQFYHKSKLVPGAERLPFRDALSFMKPLFAKFGGTTGGYGSQEEPSVFYAQSGIGAAPIICYESIWGNYVAKFIKKGAQFIAIITNDGWWGDTSGKDQHLDYAKLRAIETRRWVARSANTGISAFINQRGDIVKRTEWWKPDALNMEINLNEEITFYVKTGDSIAYLASFGSLFFGLLILLKSRRKS